MSDKYYVIRGTEDGDVRVTEHTAADLQEKLAEGYWGEGEHAPKWLGQCPSENLTDKEGAFIVRGPHRAAGAGLGREDVECRVNTEK